MKQLSSSHLITTFLLTDFPKGDSSEFFYVTLELGHLWKKKILFIKACFLRGPIKKWWRSNEWFRRCKSVVCSFTILNFYYLQAQVESTQFVNIFCDHVLPKWNEITAASGGNDIKLEVLKTFAEVTENCGEIENAQEKINTVYELLMVSICSCCIELVTT